MTDQAQPITLADAADRATWELPRAVFRAALAQCPDLAQMRFRVAAPEEASTLPVESEAIALPIVLCQEAQAIGVDPLGPRLLQAVLNLGLRILRAAPAGDPVGLVAGGPEGQLEGNPALGFLLTGPTDEGANLCWRLTWQGRWTDERTSP